MTMPHYRLRSLEVYAFRWGYHPAPNWYYLARQQGILVFTKNGLLLRTPDGHSVVPFGDMLLFMNGQISTMPHPDFLRQFEEMDGETDIPLKDGKISWLVI